MNVSKIKSGMLDLFHLFIPNNCKACGKGLNAGEEFVCWMCATELPKTNFHKTKNNPVEKLLWGRMHVQKATAWLHYGKGSMVQRLLYELKYNGQQQLGVYLGESMAHDLMKDGFLNDIDVLIPIPLHKKKQYKRGYNQSHLLAEGLAKVSGIEVDKTSVIRQIANPTQTRKSRSSRWENVSNIMKVVDTMKLEGKHVLLVDDVITTGSTMEAMTSVMETIPKIKISILALCWASDA